MSDDGPDKNPHFMDLIRELHETLGMFAGAMPITPKQAWNEALTYARQYKAKAAALDLLLEDLDGAGDSIVQGNAAELASKLRAEIARTLAQWTRQRGNTMASQYTPVYVRINCEEADCSFFVHGITDSGFGEKAADRLDEHSQIIHGCRFPKWKQDNESQIGENDATS